MPSIRTLAAGAACALLTTAAAAQPTSESPLVPPQNGPRVVDPGRHLLIGGTVHLSPDRVLPAEQVPVIRIEHGRIAAVIEDSRMVAIDTAGFRVWTLDEGAQVYAGFVEPWFEVAGHELESDRPGRHWSDHVTPERDVLDGTRLSADDAESLRTLGFVAAALAPDGGIFRGRGAVVSTAAPAENESAEPPTVYARDAFHTLDFVTSGWGANMSYPTSQMGAIALIRQVMYDAMWQREARSETNPIAPNALDALDRAERFFFETDHELEMFQAEAIGREFLLDTVLVGSGFEVRRIEGISRTGLPVILPLRYPRKPEASTVGELDGLELETMMLWEQAPTTARRLHDAGSVVALTSSKTRKRSEFFDNLREAVRHGLDQRVALRMLTETPAELLGVQDRLGLIEPGRPANLVVASAPLFDPAEDDAEIRDLWVGGVRYEINESDAKPFDGSWALRVGEDAAAAFEMRFEVDGKTVTLRTPERDAESSDSKARHVELTETTISFLIDDEDAGTGSSVFTGVLTTGADGEDRIVGSAIDPLGVAFAWHAVRAQAEEGDPSDNAEDERDAPREPDVPRMLPGYPFGPYAMGAPPRDRMMALINGTIWTSGPAGIIENGFILIEGGRIAAVGPMPEGGLDIPPSYEVLDLAGKHVTPGLIDAHSHTGTWTFGTNEAGQAVTAEVRMADTSDPDQINWYRQLAAGVTTVNTLHGSANPIGGQNVIQKVRWGAEHPRDMHLEGATPGIKFALGENVIQVNWGDTYTDRYPKTRMGVDALMRDRFTAAREYAVRWNAFLSRNRAGPERLGISPELASSFAKAAAGVPVPPSGRMPRRDLELDALAEVLAGDRLVHCHSYRQDEILMLANIARDFGFKIGSYQHGLETYKVAEAVKAHSLGGSLFSDWWAFKVEVQDAIPYAGPILWETGTPVSFNSDSDNLVRRMNTEAAKMIKYGKELGLDIPPAEALAVVTINPAVQLGIDDRVGSIEVGKDADLAVWSGDPLSSLSRSLHTFIDGREYWSEEIDAMHRERIRSERSRLVAKLIAPPDEEADDAAGDEEEPASEEQPPNMQPERRLSLRERILFDNLRAHHRSLWLEGKDTGTPMQPGDCGCGMAHMGIIR